MNHLYNGVPLPPLPEYDTAAYPYAVLDKTNAGTSFLFYAFKSRPYYGTNPADSTKMGVYSSGGAKVYYFVPADCGNEWVHQMDTDNPFAAEDGNENTLFWTNTDILYEVDGSVWLAASLPVPVADWRRSFLMGLAIGLTGNPLPYAQKEPVAYLYNGVRLPPLPAWDKASYPYVIVNFNDAGFYSLRVFTTEPAVVSKSNLTLTTHDGVYGQYMAAVFGDGKANTFDEPKTFSALLGSVTQGTIWTNFDLRYKGTEEVYFAASEPVPVYE